MGGGRCFQELWEVGVRWEDRVYAWAPSLGEVEQDGEGASVAG